MTPSLPPAQADGPCGAMGCLGPDSERFFKAASPAAFRAVGEAFLKEHELSCVLLVVA